MLCFRERNSVLAGNWEKQLIKFFECFIRVQLYVYYKSYYTMNAMYVEATDQTGNYFKHGLI